MPGWLAPALGATAGAVDSAIGAYGSSRAATIAAEAAKENKLQEKENALANTAAYAIGEMVNNSAQQAIQGVMGAGANQASAAGQAAAMGFNQGSADLANAIDSGRLTSQYGFNSAMMQNANQFNSMMWDKAAGWNEAMWEKQAAFNAEQAQIQRDWSERMENTRYQRAVKDMETAGLNPILAVTGGGMSTGAGAGQAASVGGAQMSSAQAQMASGGLLGADSASVNGYQGQLEFTGGVMNLLATALSGIGSAQQAMSSFGDFGQQMLSSLFDLFSQQPNDGKEKNGWTDWMHNPNNKSTKSYAQDIRDRMSKEKY